MGIWNAPFGSELSTEYLRSKSATPVTVTHRGHSSTRLDHNGSFPYHSSYERQDRGYCALHAVRNILHAVLHTRIEDLPTPKDMNDAQQEYYDEEASVTKMDQKIHIPDPNGNWTETSIRYCLRANGMTMEDRENPYHLLAQVPNDADAWLINRGQGHWYACVYNMLGGQRQWYNVDSLDSLRPEPIGDDS